MKHFLLSLALLMTIGCGSPAGTIVRKNYYPATSGSYMAPDFDFDMNLTGFHEVDTSTSESYTIVLSTGYEITVSYPEWQALEVGKMYGTMEKEK